MKIYRFKQVEMFADPFPNHSSRKRVNQVAKKSKKIAKKSAPAKAAPAKKSAATDENEGKKAVMLHLNPRLHGAAKITAQALGTNLSKVLRKLLAEWITENKKKAMQFIDKGASFDEDEDIEETEEETEDEDVEDEDVEEESDEDEEEEDEDEE